MANTMNSPTDNLSSKNETTNYCRIILLMVDVGTETLVHLFRSCIEKQRIQTVQSYFASKKLEIEDGKKKKVFNKSQYAKLTCPEPNIDEFDISLLIKLLTYFNLSPVKLDCLQTIRNEIIGHASKAELTKQHFERLWDNVENILLNIARCVNQDELNETQLKIEELKQTVLYVSDRENIINAFETWCQEEMTLLQENIATLRVDATERTDKKRERIENLNKQFNEMTDKIQMLITNLHDLISGSFHPAYRQYTLNEENFSAEDWIIFKKLQRDLIRYYRRVLSKLQLSHLIEEEGYAANFFDFYIKPNINILSHQRPKGQSESKPATFHDIFSSKPCQNIYILSPAGCGKTSFAKYLALIWCQAHLPVDSDNQQILKEDIDEMRTFMFLFILYLRDEQGRECDIDIMIQNQLLPNLANSTAYTKLGIQFLQSLLSNVKCILILDGLDEWSHPAGNKCVLKNQHIPHSRARPLCTTLTTTRPWKLDVVKLKPEDIDKKLELNCLEKDLLQSLIRNVVKKLNELYGKNMQADDFEQELRNKKLTDLSNIPVVVMQLLTLWFDEVPLGESQCEIYSNMIEFLLKRYCKKREIVSEIEGMEVDDCNRNRQTPMYLQNSLYCKVHMELLAKLATLAYYTLFTDHEELSLVFDRRIAKKYLTDKEIEMSLAVGILTQERVTGKISKRESHNSFIHKTFQEYLAALYVALNPGTVTNVKEKIKWVCYSIEKILEMSQIFMFLSGLCPEVMVNLHEHLRQTVSKDSRTQRYRASCKLDPKWSREGEIMERVQVTTKAWLGECWLNGHKHVTHLPVSDFFIESPSEWSVELKSLTIHNPVCSLYVHGVDCSQMETTVEKSLSLEEIEGILNSVTVFDSIQKLWLWAVSETFVVQLVFQHRHSLSLRPQAWRHLECVTLEWVRNMSGDILCTFVDSILKLPKSVKVRLEECCIRQGTRDWKAYIWSHPRLSVDVDFDVDRNNVNLLQFQTNKV